MTTIWHDLEATMLLLVLLALMTGPAAQTRAAADSAELLDRFRRTTVFWRQLEVAEELARAGNPRVLDALAPWLQHEDRHLRGNAAFVFARLGDPRGFDTIRAILADQSRRPVGQGIPGGSFNIAQREWWLNSQIHADRYYAIHLFGRLQDPRAVDVLVPLLGDADLGYQAAWALGEIGDRRAIAPLLQALKHPDALARVNAIDGLERLRAKEAVPYLREMVSDIAVPRAGPRMAVGARAREALARLEYRPLDPVQPHAPRPTRIGDVAVTFTSEEMRDITGIAGCGTADPWLILSARGQVVEVQFVEVFCEATATSASVRRGDIAWVSRRRVASGWTPWTRDQTFRYAQLLDGARPYYQLESAADRHRPIRLHGPFGDEELISLAAFLRTHPMGPGGRAWDQVQGTWAFTRVTRGSDGTVQAVLSKDQWESQVVTLRRVASGWEILRVVLTVV